MYVVDEHWRQARVEEQVVQDYAHIVVMGYMRVLRKKSSSVSIFLCVLFIEILGFWLL